MEETNYNQHSYAYQLNPSPFIEKYNNNGTEWESKTEEEEEEMTQVSSRTIISPGLLALPI